MKQTNKQTNKQTKTNNNHLIKLLMVLLFLPLINCQKEETRLEDKVSNTSASNIQKVNSDYFENNSKLQEKLNALTVGKGDESSDHDRSVFNQENGFYIDTSSAIFIEEGDYHSYTFAIYSGLNEDIENLLLSYNETTLDYEAYRTSYNLSPEQEIDALNADYNNGLSQGMIKEISKIDFSTSLSQGRSGYIGGIRTLPDGRCGYITNIDPDPDLDIIWVTYHVVPCPSGITTDNNPQFIDVQDAGSNSAINIIMPSSFGGSQIWTANDWEAAGGGSFTTGDGQVIYYPTLNTLPVVNYQYSVIKALGIGPNGVNPQPEIVDYINGLSSHDAREFYDFLEENGNTEAAKTQAGIYLNILMTNPNITIKLINDWFLNTPDFLEQFININPDNITYSEALTQQSLPSLNDFVNHFPKQGTSGNYSEMATSEVYNLVGGSLLTSHQNNPSAYSNACSIRGSRGLLYSGINIPVLNYPNVGQRTQKGGDNKNYILDAVSFDKFMRDKFGVATYELTGADANDPVQVANLLNGKSGIYVIINNSPAQAGYSGHVDGIINGDCISSAYTTPSGGVKSIRIWELN